MTRFFGILVMPAICCAAIAYFSYYAIWGARGWFALAEARAHLSARQQQLLALKDDRARLEHRIGLLRPGAEDPDLIEELARGQMLGSAPGQVAVPRNRQ